MAKAFAIFLLVSSGIVLSQGSDFNCSFDNGNSVSPGPAKCGYQNAWGGMQAGNWKVTKSFKKLGKGNNYFAIFRARNRPEGFWSRLGSYSIPVLPDTCLTFSYALKGVRTPFPQGRSLLEVYFSVNHRPLRKGQDKPLWSTDKRTKGKSWAKAEVTMPDKGKRRWLRGSLIFAAVRGGSSRAYIAIDDIVVKKCQETPAKQVPSATLDQPSNSVVGQNKTSSDPLDMIRTLAAYRPIQTRDFSLPPGAVYDPADPATLPSLPRTNRGKTGSRGNRRRKGRGKKKKQLGVVYFTEEPGEPLPDKPFVPTLVEEERPQTLCDFAHYTQGLKKCLRAFFSMLKQHRSQAKCNSDYLILEQCLQTAATKCVPDGNMTAQQVNEVVGDTLRNKFKTQQVYCLEEGAFVFPKFALGSIPLQCSREYFGKLTGCGGSFAGLFHFKHGDPNLCKEYFHANECQRQTTAEECNFDARSMLIYGLNLQYQFAHNPFCIDLPFSSWWPTTE